MSSLKEKMLELLEKDREFRYTVAGYLGLSEIMKRLDVLSEEQTKLREEQTKIWRELEGLRKEQTKIWMEIKGLREEQTKIWEEIRELKEEQIKLREEQTKIWKEIEGLRGEQTKIWMEIKGLKKEQTKLREDFNKMLSVIRNMNSRLIRVERTLEKLTLDIEEEARSILAHRIRRELGVKIELGSLILPDLELNIYGATDEICIVGEASVRAGVRVLSSLLEKLEILKARYPEKLRKRIILVIYTSLPMPDLIERAKERNVWVLKATGDFVKSGFT